MRRMGVAIATCICAALPAMAQLNQNCTVSVLNRTVNVNSDGSWVLPNIPANFGQVKARATCTQNGVTTFGESDWFTVPPNGAVNLPAITMGNTTPIPTSLSIAAVANLTAAGKTAQLAVTATYPDGSTKDVTPSASGTNYTISNPAIATISTDGLITAVSSGTVVIQANNDGATGISTVIVVIGGQTVGGIPVSWLLQYHLNPNDPLVAMEDPDRDGLTNLQEFQAGTDPTNPDTDGDGLSDGDEVNKYHTNPLLADTDGDKIPDGVEVQTGTNPLDPSSYDLRKATTVSTVTPPSFTLSTSLANPVLSVQLDWKVQLIDGELLDLTTDPRTHYASSDMNICSFGQQPGLIFAGSAGTCTITISQNTLSVPVAGTVSSFTPTELSVLSIPGAVAVDVGGNFAYVAAGTNGLAVVDVNDRTHPFVRSTVSKIGSAQGVRTAGQYVYVADATGNLWVINVQNPDVPAIVSSLTLSGTPSALTVHGNLAAIATQAAGISLVDITIPSSPKLLGTLSTPSSAIGVDFDSASGLAAIAMGTAGLRLADISNPAWATLRGALPGGDVRRVLLRLPAALLADAQRSITSVDVSNPDSPSLSTSLAPNLGGVPVDIAGYGNIAMTADITFGKATPIINISTPLEPSSVGFWQWQSYPGYGSGIALDLQYGYLVLSSDSVLRILQYQNINDNHGIPPQVSITSPVNGATLVQGDTITFAVNATDDVAVASVNFLVDGEMFFTTSAQPYQIKYRVPESATMLIFGATALDYGNNPGVAQNVTVNVIPDPLTTLTGRVVDPNGNPVGSAKISALGLSTTSAADGTFALASIPTIDGPIVVQAIGVVNRITLAGYSQPVDPVGARGLTVSVGDVKILPAPGITAIVPKSILSNVATAITVTGFNLTGSMFTFVPANTPAIAIGAVVISADGTSATMSVNPGEGTTGHFTLVASNPAGSSSSAAALGFVEGGSSYNTISIPGSDPNADPDNDGLTNAQEITAGTDPLNADTDADAFPDGLEVALGTDPLNPNDFPSATMLSSSGQLALAFSVLNEASPFQTESGAGQIALTFSLLNQSSPYTTNPAPQQVTQVFSLLNQSSPFTTNPAPQEVTQTFSLLNQSSPYATNPAPQQAIAVFSLLNQLSPLNQSSPYLETVFSVLNGQSTNPTNATAPFNTALQPNALLPQEIATNSTESSTNSAVQEATSATQTLNLKRVSLAAWKEIRSHINASLDTNHNGLPDDFERWICGTATCANPDDDPDHDGLTNMQEWLLGTNPIDPDTDHDGLTDGAEVQLGTDPLNGDTDGDGWIDGDEVAAHSDPLDPSSVPKMPPRPAEYFVGPVFSIQNSVPEIARVKPKPVVPDIRKGENLHETKASSSIVSAIDSAVERTNKRLQ